MIRNRITKLAGPPPLPSGSRNAAQFVANMRRVREWAGHEPLRTLAQRAGMPHTTLGEILQGRRDKLPDLDLVMGFLAACGVNNQDVLGEWRYTWRYLKEAEVEARRLASPRRLVSVPRSPAS